LFQCITREPKSISVITPLVRIDIGVELESDAEGTQSELVDIIVNPFNDEISAALDV
jgi:hypothetical protein